MAVAPGPTGGDQAKGAIKLRKDTYRSCLAWGIPKAAHSYWQAKRSAAWVVTVAKTQMWEEFCEAMEQDFQSTTKKFWQAIQWHRRGKQNSVHTVFGVGGVADLNRVYSSAMEGIL